MSRNSVAFLSPAPGSGNPQPGRACLSERTWRTAVIYIAAVAMFLRFYALTLKPLHHDEAVNTLFLTKLVRPPHLYQYNPANFHGPTLYYFGWLSTALFGVTTFAVRFVTSLTGLVTVLLILALRRQIGIAGALAAASLIALSPGAVYFSRYFIHESLLVCFTLGTVVAATMWVDRARPLFLYLAAVSAGLMFSTKETAIISAVVLTAAAAGAAWLFEFRTAVRDGGPVSSARRLSSVVAALRCIVSRRPLGTRHLLMFAWCIGLFLAVNLLFYTSLFTHWQGAIDAFNTFAFWTKTGTTRHTHDWHTYLNWLSQEELPLLLLGAAGAGLALWRADNRFAVFAALWAVGILAAYSVIPYKTPWLALNMIVPLAITGGYASELAWQSRRALPPIVAIVSGAAIVGVISYQTVVLNFVRYDDGRYPYAYVHTHRELLALVDEIHRLRTLNPEISIAVTSKDHFPLSWYLRDYPVAYYGRAIVTNDPLVIGSVDQRQTLDRALGDRYERLGPYRLRPGVRLVLYARRGLRKVASARAADPGPFRIDRRSGGTSWPNRVSTADLDLFTRRLL